MTAGRSHISEEDFKRYLENKMSVKERNSFEKQLQKDSFDAEAIEGYEIVGLTDIQKDMEELKGKIQPTKKKNTYRYLAAAATILLLVTAGVIWMQFSNENPIPKVAEKSELEINEPELIKPKISDEKFNSENTRIQQEASQIKQTEQQVHLEKSEQKNEVTIAEMEAIESDDETEKLAVARSQKRVAASPKIQSDKNIALASDSSFLDARGIQYEGQTGEALSKTKTIRGKVISAGDGQPLPGVTLVEKGTNNLIVSDMVGNFELQLLNDSTTVVVRFVGMESAEFEPSDDSVLQIELEPSNIAMNEVVVTGYESQKKKSLMSSSTRISKDGSKSSKPGPVCGMDEYNNYLEKTAILPVEYPNSKETVKLLLKLDDLGGIISIESRNNVDSTILEKAKEIVFDGPNWSPELKNGKYTESEVKLKIIFRKKE